MQNLEGMKMQISEIFPMSIVQFFQILMVMVMKR
ncbi:hypothetical protein D917_06863 [Trichinella nativa]|uniref:Uncharacterized protein n=1 Tax=Trichinella nativa TaxID=6335 RepID=A0A1Y3ERZ6_9BILA|nr:hypothetical protein D917_06863 [Trichinella nativa]